MGANNNQIEGRGTAPTQTVVTRPKTATVGYDPKDVRVQPNVYASGLPATTTTTDDSGGGLPWPTGGGRRSGNSNPMATNFGPFADKVLALLRARAAGLPASEFGLAAPTDKLSPMISKAVGDDIAFADKTFGGVARREGDPFANLNFQAQQFDPGIGNMVGAQGGDANAATMAQQSGQSDQDYMAQLYNNHARSLSANQQASNAAYNTDVGRDAAYTKSSIKAQESGLLAGATLRQEEAQRQWEFMKWQHEQQQRADEQKRQDDFMQMIIQLLSTGYGNGANVAGINLEGF
jgi:hypothetical protein